MSFSNIDSLALGNFLLISFCQGVRDQLSQYHEEFNMVKSQRVDGEAPREKRFLLMTGRGPAAAQYRNPGDNTQAFPTAQRTSNVEGVAKFKELDATIELEYQLWDRARRTPEKYAEPLAMEMAAKEMTVRRLIARDFYGDGTGVVATVGSVSDTGLVGSSANKIVVTIRDNDTDRGFVGFCEYDDLLIAKQNGGSARAPTETSGSSFYAWKVTGIDRSLGISACTVTLAPVDSAGAVVTDITASNLVAGDVLYRIGQATIPNLASISDYGTASEVLAGLEALTKYSGETVHGLTMSGSVAGTHYDCSNAVIDTSHLQGVMNLVKQRVGAGRYNWKKLLTSWEAISALIEAREADRRFITIDDTTRGAKRFAFQHASDTLEFVPSEFCPFRRAWGIPETKAGEKVLEIHMSDFDAVRAQNGDIFHLSPGSGTYNRLIQSFLMGHAVILAQHPAAIAKLHNFKLS